MKSQLLQKLRKVARCYLFVYVALSVVLIGLLLREVSNSFNPAARGIAIQLTVTSLLVSPAVMIPCSGDRTVQVVGEVKDCADGSAIQLVELFRW